MAPERPGPYGVIAPPPHPPLPFPLQPFAQPQPRPHRHPLHDLPLPPQPFDPPDPPEPLKPEVQVHELLRRFVAVAAVGDARVQLVRPLPCLLDPDVPPFPLLARLALRARVRPAVHLVPAVVRLLLNAVAVRGRGPVDAKVEVCLLPRPPKEFRQYLREDAWVAPAVRVRPVPVQEALPDDVAADARRQKEVLRRRVLPPRRPVGVTSAVMVVPVFALPSAFAVVAVVASVSVPLQRPVPTAPTPVVRRVAALQ